VRLALANLISKTKVVYPMEKKKSGDKLIIGIIVVLIILSFIAMVLLALRVLGLI